MLCAICSVKENYTTGLGLGILFNSPQKKTFSQEAYTFQGTHGRMQYVHTTKQTNN